MIEYVSITQTLFDKEVLLSERMDEQAKFDSLGWSPVCVTVCCGVVCMAISRSSPKDHLEDQTNLKSLAVI